MTPARLGVPGRGTPRRAGAPGVPRVGLAGGEMAESLEGAPAVATLSDPRGTNAQAPEETSELLRKQVPTAAGGVAAVTSALRHAFGEAGVARGTRLLLRVNQVDGYDCPGCAWPDPDSGRAVAEFCENGAKAVAEEGTTRKVGPEFFARHSVAELSQRSDYWLGKQGRLTHPMVLRRGGGHYPPLSLGGGVAPLAA